MIDAVQPDYRSRARPWLIAIFISSLVIALLLACIGIFIWWALVLHPSQTELRTSLLKLNVASGQGVNLPRFSDLVLDARTKFELAERTLSSDQAKAAKEAVQDFEAVNTIWSERTQEGNHYCPSLCEENLFPALKQLGIVANKKAFQSYAADTANSWSEESVPQNLVSRGLTISALQTEIALAKL